MDALDHLEKIAQERGWILRLEMVPLNYTDGHQWRIDFGPRDDPDKVHHISTALWEDAADLMMAFIVRTGLNNMAGEKD